MLTLTPPSRYHSYAKPGYPFQLPELQTSSSPTFALGGTGIPPGSEISGRLLYSSVASATLADPTRQMSVARIRSTPRRPRRRRRCDDVCPLRPRCPISIPP